MHSLKNSGLGKKIRLTWLTLGLLCLKPILWIFSTGAIKLQWLWCIQAPFRPLRPWISGNPSSAHLLCYVTAPACHLGWSLFQIWLWPYLHFLSMGSMHLCPFPSPLWGWQCHLLSALLSKANPATASHTILMSHLPTKGTQALCWIHLKGIQTEYTAIYLQRISPSSLFNSTPL